jgi:hypothetical protein
MKQHVDFAKQAKQAGAQFKRWQWLHFDILVDEDAKAWVEEINCNGFFIGNRYGYTGNTTVTPL